MTFSHGDYANIEAIPDKDRTAEMLYTKALRYFPNHRAYLGLGMVYQKHRNFQKAQQILSEGIGHYPQSDSLNLCMGITLMNQGDFNKALEYLLKIRNSQDAAYYIAQCRQASGSMT